MVPDALSRGVPIQEMVSHIALCQPTKPDPNLPVSWDEIGKAQKLDSSLQALWIDSLANASLPTDAQVPLGLLVAYEGMSWSLWRAGRYKYMANDLSR